MPHLEKHPVGAFCWIELATTDQTAAKHFYGSLFDWSINDFPMGPSEVYTMFTLEGRDAAAAYAIRQDQMAQGVPPHWALYVAVENADQTVAVAGELGANLLAGPFDVFEFGRMAVLQDPTGAVISIWQPKQHVGTRVTGRPGTLCWADLSTPDTDRGREFYSKLFGWTIEPGEKDPTTGYLHIKNNGEFIGGIQPAEFRNPHAPPHWLSYFEVADCDNTTAKAKAMGGNTILPPTTLENVGRFAVLSDPQGAVFAIFKQTPPER